MKTQSLMGLLLTALASVGCASLQSVSVTNIPAERGRPVQAEESNVGFLGIHFSNDFADDLPDELRRQCPKGKVTGIYSKYENTWYVIVDRRKVTAKGYCVSGAQQGEARAQRSAVGVRGREHGRTQPAPLRIAEASKHERAAEENPQ